MKRSLLIVAAVSACAALQAADAAPRHHRHYAPHPHHRGSFYFAAPLSAWAYYPAPAYAWVYPPPYEPPIVERVYEVPAYREPPRAYREPPRTYREAPRIYGEAPRAQPTPPPKVAALAPRLERYSLSARELFDFDKADLRQPQPKLDEIAKVLRENPQFDHVMIEGHTDRLGTEAYNAELSKRRADAVKDYLVGRGVEARRLVAVGKGESEPVVQCNGVAKDHLVKCLEPNRRVEVQQITVERRVPAT